MAALTVSQSLLISDRVLIEDSLDAVLPAQSSPVCRAMRYAVLGTGQRLRPLLTLRVARILGADMRWATRAAAAVELLHCASLIVDDLPCMDNDAMRRNRPAVHIEFGQATAVLSAFALVSLAARSVAEQSCFQMKLLATLDCGSLIGGQALDLELSGELRHRERQRVTSLKTVPLFQLAVDAGLAGAQASPRTRQTLLEFGRQFGLCYQLTDDYLDGEISDRTEVEHQIQQTRTVLQAAGCRADPLDDLVDYLNEKLWETDRGHR